MRKIRTMSFFRISLPAVFFFLIFLNPLSFSQPVIIYSPVIAGLSSPVDIVNAGDNTNRIFIAQQGGIIKVYNSSYVFLDNFLTVTGISTGGERGLLSIVFHPDYESNGFFWVYYTNASGNLEVARYQVSANPNQADPATKQIVITIPHPVNSNHNGAKLNFGPDGYLYFGTGDGGGAGDVPNNAQNGNVLLGKMLRINVSTTPGPPYYTIPPDNPFVLDPTVLDEIFALGLRNPFRWSFDRSNGDMWIGDVGQNLREEIDYRPVGTTAGVNYGWRCYEGNLPYNTTGCGPASNYVFPIYDYLNPPASSAAVTGGIVYRGIAFPAMQGYYFATDVYSGDLYLINTNTGFTTSIQTGLPNFVAGFGESEAGELFAVSLSGTAYALTTNSALPVRLIRFDGTNRNGNSLLSWETASEQDLKQFEIEYGTDAITFSRAGVVPAKNAINGFHYYFEHRPLSFTGIVYYRLKIVDKDGRFFYSPVINIKSHSENKLFVYPSPVHVDNIFINISEPYNELQIFNSNGSIVHRQFLNEQTGRISVQVKNIIPGFYLFRLSGDRGSISQKVVVERW